MKTSNIIIGLIVIALIVGGFFFFTNRAEAPYQENENGSEATQPAGEGGNFEDTPETPTNTSGSNNDSGTGVNVNGGVNVDVSGNDSTNTDVNEQPTSSVKTVTYTNDGFSPSTITIKQGDTVRFVNQSSTDNMWVGSDIHPTHTQYAGKSSSDCLGSSFDQCTAVGSGSVFEFTFDHVGTWGYHNHVRASKRGTVIVQ